MDLALFDFDGTLTRSDSFVPFLRFSSSRLRWFAGSAVLLPVSLGYRLGVLRASPVRATASVVAFLGRQEASLRRLGADFAATILPHELRPEMLEKLQWHQARGDRVVVVSASLDLYLQPWCVAHSVDLLCTTLSAVGGKLTGIFRGGDCNGESKAERIRSSYELSEFARIWAYGDTPEDFPMLRLADHKFFRGEEVEVVPSE